MQDKKVMEFETFSPEETLELGRKFGREAHPHRLYARASTVGTETICLFRARASPLAVAEPILSPVKDPGPADTAITSIVFRSSSIISCVSLCMTKRAL